MRASSRAPSRMVVHGWIVMVSNVRYMHYPMQGVVMQMSELAARTGVPVATLKFYLREGLLHPGVALSQTRAAYDDAHIRRVGVIRALTETVGLSVQQARGVLEVIDAPG